MRLLGKRGVSLRANGALGATAWGAFMWRAAVALVFGAMLAKWTWVIFAPHSPSVLPAAQPASGFQAEQLFGVAAVSSVAGTSAFPNVRLVGVFAGTPGFAMLELDGKRQVGLATGAEIVAGARLVEVAIDHVVIERGGVRQQIQLEGKAAAIKSAAAAKVQAIPLSQVPVSPAAAAVSATNATMPPNVNAAAQDWRETQQSMMRDR